MPAARSPIAIADSAAKQIRRASARQVQAELESDRAQLATARPQQKADLQAKISELQGELELINARKSLLATMSTFSNQSDTNGFSAERAEGADRRHGRDRTGIGGRACRAVAQPRGARCAAPRGHCVLDSRVHRRR